MWKRYPWMWKLFAFVALINVAGLVVDLGVRPVDHIGLATNLFGLVVFASMAILALRAGRESETSL